MKVHTTITISSELKEKAQALKVNISEVCELALYKACNSPVLVNENKCIVCGSAENLALCFPEEKYFCEKHEKSRVLKLLKTTNGS